MILTRRWNDCGVCAVANVLGKPWAVAALRIFGPSFTNRLRFSTTTRKLATALGMKQWKLIRVKRWADIPSGSVVKVIPDACKGTGHWHWVVWEKGVILDGMRMFPARAKDYPHRLVSYLIEVK